MSTASSAASRKQAFADHVAELMDGFARVQAKPMFGGFGIYRDGLMFALIADETLYFKVDDASRARFDARGLAPFTYETKGGRKSSLNYREAPPEVYDEPGHMAAWSKLGYECALRQQARKAASGKAGKKKPAAAGKAAALADLRNLGDKSREMLAKAGIKTAAQLKKLGAVRAYARTKAVCPKASLNLLWALEGALSDRAWQDVAESERASLLMALDDVRRQEGG